MSLCNFNVGSHNPEWNQAKQIKIATWGRYRSTNVSGQCQHWPPRDRKVLLKLHWLGHVRMHFVFCNISTNLSTSFDIKVRGRTFRKSQLVFYQLILFQREFYRNFIWRVEITDIIWFYLDTNGLHNIFPRLSGAESKSTQQTVSVTAIIELN